MTTRLAKRPRDIADCVGAYLQEGDLDGVVSMFHPQCRIFFPPDQPPSIGPAGARTVFEGFAGMRPILNSQVISETIVGDTALLQANWTFAAQDGSVLAQGRSTEVAFRLENGGWGYLIDCPNGLPPVTPDSGLSESGWSCRHI